MSHHWKCGEQKENFQTSLVITSWNFTMFQYRSDKSQVKRYVVSSTANSVYQVSYELPNDLRLRISGNKEMLGKSQIRVQCSAQATLQKLNFGNSNQKTRKGRHYPCLVQPYWISSPYSKYPAQDCRPIRICKIQWRCSIFLL